MQRVYMNHKRHVQTLKLKSQITLRNNSQRKNMINKQSTTKTRNASYTCNNLWSASCALK